MTVPGSAPAQPAHLPAADGILRLLHQRGALVTHMLPEDGSDGVQALGDAHKQAVHAGQLVHLAVASTEGGGEAWEDNKWEEDVGKGLEGNKGTLFLFNRHRDRTGISLPTCSLLLYHPVAYLP